MRKIRILAVTDAAVKSGFGIIADNIFSRLALTGDYDIHINASNYIPTDEPLNLPYRLIPAQIYRENGAYQFGDIYGIKTLPDRIRKIKPDVLWLQNDLQVLRRFLEIEIVKEIPTIAYYPIDGQPIVPPLALPLKNCLNVTYTRFGQEAMAKNGIHAEVIYPGIDPFQYHPLHEDTRAAIKEKLGLEGKFVVLRVDKFQPRKNWPATIKTFDMFAKQLPSAVLYTHCRWQDSGGDLMDVASRYPSLDGRIFRTEAGGDPFINLPTGMMNQLYNAADVFLTTTMGEGLGLSTLEAMATKTPVVGTNYAATAELIKGRGFLIDVDKLEPTGFGADHAVISESSAFAALLQVYRNGKKVKEQTEKGYEFAQSLNWEKIVKQWDEVFRSVVKR